MVFYFDKRDIQENGKTLTYTNVIIIYFGIQKVETEISKWKSVLSNKRTINIYAHIHTQTQINTFTPYTVSVCIFSFIHRSLKTSSKLAHVLGPLVTPLVICLTISSILDIFLSFTHSNAYEVVWWFFDVFSILWNGMYPGRRTCNSVRPIVSVNFSFILHFSFLFLISILSNLVQKSFSSSGKV